MKTHRPIVVVLSASLLCAAAFAEEQPLVIHDAHGTQPFHTTVAGTCTNKDDFSFTGAPLFLSNGTNINVGAIRVFCNFAGKGSHGEFTGQLFADEQPTTSTCTLPGGVPGGGSKAVIPAWLFILSFNERQDQLFLSSSSGTACVDLSTNVGFNQTSFNVIGGTGRFEGASGTISFADKSIALAFSRLATLGVVAPNSGTLDGFITLK